MCVASLAWWFIIRDVLAWVLFIRGHDLAKAPQPTALESLMTILLALLGLGTMRTIEKVKGVASEEVK